MYGGGGLSIVLLLSSFDELEKKKKSITKDHLKKKKKITEDRHLLLFRLVLCFLLLLGECFRCDLEIVLVSTTVYGISRSCDSDIPSVSIRLKSKCFFSSVGSLPLLPSDGDRDLDLRSAKLFLIS